MVIAIVIDHQTVLIKDPNTRPSVVSNINTMWVDILTCRNSVCRENLSLTAENLSQKLNWMSSLSNHKISGKKIKSNSMRGDDKDMRLEIHVFDVSTKNTKE